MFVFQQEAYLLQRLESKIQAIGSGNKFGMETEGSDINVALGRVAALAQIKAWVKDKTITLSEITECAVFH